ncbi:DUF4380 domain-containing protein [Gaoshiqia sp. Z1-71]|uniref:DUF4380 domain-containing protein n=1 Tax=Gaoshiqia hydrogeniformans TaxID=3290090 RepID=UPI003BF90C09
MPGFTNYRNWNVCLLKNQRIKLYATPQLGGRLMQMEMEGHEFFFVNPLLAGKEPDSTRLGANGAWLNFGGEKIWPAPQGWNSPDQWPGPPDPVLDSGNYTAEFRNKKELKLTSPVDPYTGLQITKEVSVAETRTEVKVLVTFRNMGKTSKRWSVWPVLQMNTPEENVGQYQIVCPVNPESKFSKGYKVMHGLVNNPQYSLNANGNVQVDYQYLVGKIGLDPNSGWAAFIDKKSGKALILMSQFQKGKLYPEDTSFQVWTSGRGMVYSRNVIRQHPDDKKLNPPYMEMELLSPLQEIEPGKEIQYEYSMLATTIPANETAESANELGVIAKPLSAKPAENGILIQAKYGVFSEGILKICRKKQDEKAPACLHETEVNPSEAVDIDFLTNESGSKSEVTITADFFDREGHFLGEIDKLKMKRYRYE